VTTAADAPAGKRAPSRFRSDSSARFLPDQVWVPALVAAVLALAFVGALLVRAGGDVSLLVHAGPPWSDDAGSRGSLTVQPAEDAFDGQFFYRIGVEPWSTDETVDGVTFDLPALRNARWGYGALAYVASGGNPDLVPWALVGLNVAAAAAVGAVGGGLARSSGRHAAWGLLLVLWPGFAYSLSLDTSELVASAFVLGGLLAVRHRRWAAAVAAFTAAVLTRDTTAVIPFGIAAAGAWTWWSTTRRDPGQGGSPAGVVASGDATDGDATGSVAIGDGYEERERRPDDDRIGPLVPEPIDRGGAQGGGAYPAPGPLLIAGLFPLVAFGGWQLLQRARFGELPLTSSGDNNLSLPLGGLATELGSLLPPGGTDEAFRLLSALGLVALLGAAAWCWGRSTAPLAERLAWLPAVAVVVMLNAYLWSGATAFMRAATEAGLLSILVILGSGRRALITLAAGGLGVLWTLTALGQLTRLG
jgi:hypothetical protein